MGPKKPWKASMWKKRQRDAEQKRGDSTNSSSLPDEDGQVASSGQGDHEPERKKPRADAMNLSQVKGHQAIVGTCDIHHDRQAAAELIDLLSTFADKVFPEDAGPSAPRDDSRLDETHAVPANDGDKTEESSTPIPAASAQSSSKQEASAKELHDSGLSIEELVRREADALRAGSEESRKLVSVSTGVKGVVMVCIVSKRIDAVKLVDAIFSEIRDTQKRQTRFLQRITPLSATAFAEIESFKVAIRPVISAALPPVAAGVPPATSEGETDGTTVVTTNHDEKTSASPGHVPDAETKDEGRGGGSGGDAADPVAGPCAIDGQHDENAEKVLGKGSEAGVDAGGDTPTDTPTAAGERWSFRIDPRRRNSGLGRKDLIDAAAAFVGKGHRVSMKSPDVSPPLEHLSSLLGSTGSHPVLSSRERS